MSTAPRLSTRAELAARHGLSMRTLARLWADRDTNDHPAPLPDTSPMQWDSAEWARWFDQLPPGTGTGTGTATATPPDVPPAGNPADLIGPAEFARILGLKSPSWVTRCAHNPPHGFPAPDDWADPVARRGPKWRRGRVEAYRDERPGIAIARPGRPRATTTTTPYADDPRLTLARQALTDHPGTAAGRIAVRLSEDHPDTGVRTWQRILKAAKDTRSGPDTAHRS
ncbi:hypothetical protein [Streptomyces sp. NPDC001108]